MTIDLFSTGEEVLVSLAGAKHGYLKLLKLETNQVWEIRSLDPKPSLRVFGRFAIKDVFIATHVCDRASLGGEKSKNWRNEIERCKTEWTKLFATYPPLRGHAIHDYISENVVCA